MRGWVYIISNTAMPGIIKVGYTMSDPELRARELNHTGSPHPYKVLYDVLVDEPRDIEQRVHALLSSSLEGKEWFRCSLGTALETIRSVVGNKIILESIKESFNLESIKSEQPTRDYLACRRCEHLYSGSHCEQCDSNFEKQQTFDDLV